jgi:LacI family transcriptional regulator
MSIKLKDIAKIHDVSIATVSLVLNDKPIRISEEKRLQILETAKEMNYRANLAARTLVTKKSHILGLIVPDIENVFFSKLAKNLEEICLNNHYILLILISNDHLNSDLMLLDLLISRQVDGIFLCPSNEAFNSDLLTEKLKGITTPVILVDRVFRDSPLNKVYFDHQAGAYEAVTHLIAKGHQKIAIIAPPVETKLKNPRLAGYLHALEDHHLPVDENLIYHGDYKFKSGYQIAQKILQTDVTAVFSCNDMMTLGFLKAAQEKGIQIPRDISLVSYDNILDDFTFGVEVTSVVQDTALLAQESFKVYQKYIKSKKPKEMILKTEMINRDSVLNI